jgi:hypothetical protein
MNTQTSSQSQLQAHAVQDLSILQCFNSTKLPFRVLWLLHYDEFNLAVVFEKYVALNNGKRSPFVIPSILRCPSHANGPCPTNYAVLV